MRACAVCGARCEGDRCPLHARRGSWGSRLYRRNRRLLLAGASTCWRCGYPLTESDPATAGHVVPLAEGGTDELGNLRAEHESCNKRAGRAQQDAPPAWRPDERSPVVGPRLFA